MLKRLLPFVTWFDGYNRRALRADLIAGLTVALVLVPQSMAYAQLAGLPPYFGLYASFLPPMIASLFGSSRQLATGPVAVVSLMTAAALEPLATAGGNQYIAYALLLALMVGLFQFALGVLRLGVVVNFLSHPVVNGFTNAAALIIATSQLSKLFGVHVDKAAHHYETVWRVIRAAFQYTHWPTLGMAIIAFLTILVLRRVNRKIPNVLVAVVVTTFIAWVIGFEANETVDARQIASEEALVSIRTFNELVRKKTQLEHHRSLAQKDWQQITNNPGVCLSCHGRGAKIPRVRGEINTSHRGGRGARLARQKEGETIDVFNRRVTPPGGMDRPTNAVVISPRAPSLMAKKQINLLHQKAGLFEDRITELKQLIADKRAQLREKRFVLVKNQHGEPRFYLSTDIPAGSPAQSTGWRLLVKNSVIRMNALTLSGGGAVVGTIPQGLPGFLLPELDWGIMPKLIAAAMIISLLGFMEAISIAKAMAARTRQKLDPNQELMGQGLANIIGCLGQSYAVSGSFSRSAVNLQAGAKTGLSNVFSSAIVLLVLLFFSPLLYHLPQAVLATIIMVAVFGLLNVSGFLHAWRTSRFDGAVLVISFVGTLVFAPHLEWGIVIGVSLSLGAYLYRSMRPQVVDLAPHPDGSLRDAKRFKLQHCQHITVFSFEGPLNFASGNYLENEILGRVAELPDLRHLLIAGNGISEIDASGEETLRHIVDNLRDAKYDVSFSGMPEKVMDVLKRSRLWDHIGEQCFFTTRAKAIVAIYGKAHARSTEQDCPYRVAMPPLIELSLHEDGNLRSVERHSLETCRHIVLFRFDAPLNFANTSFLEQEIQQYVADRPTLRHIVFVSHGISDIDDMGARKIKDLVQLLRKDGYAVSFSGLKEEVLEVLEKNRIIAELEPNNLYPTQLMAIAGIYASAHAGSSEVGCPLARIAPHLTELSLHDSGILRDAHRYHLKLCRRIAVLRIDGPLALSSRKAFQSEFIRWAKARPTVHSVIFSVHALGKMDRTEANNLLALTEAVREAGYRVLFAGFTDQALETLARLGVADALDVENIYFTITNAISAIYVHAHVDIEEDNCPLRGLLPRIVELAMHPDGSLRDAHHHDLALCARIIAVRIDGPLDLSTIEYFEEQLKSIIQRRPMATHILIAAHSLRGLDTIAAEELPRVLARLRQEGLNVAISGLKDEELEILRRTEGNTFGADAIFPTQARAIEALEGEAHQGSDEKVCPLKEVVFKPGQTTLG